MDAIIWHKGMPCKPTRHGWKVKVWESKASGQRELLIYPRTVYLPLESDGEQAPCPWVASDAFDAPDVDLEALEAKAERSAQKAAARARRNCRHKIKHAGFTQLLTLTYKANVRDLDRMRRDFAAWLRIMRRLIPGFRCVYGFEQQTRGAWHCHVATDKLPLLMQYRGCKVQSWKVGTAVWRSVVPEGGMCFVGGRRGRFNRYSSAGRIAGYISKYLTKDNAAGEAGRRMWDSTQKLTPPPAVTLELPPMDIGDAVALAFELRFGEEVLKHMICKDGDVWLLHTEPGGLLPSGHNK
jgi:hypothetical protein